MRPAVVVARSGRDDWILCQVTSNPYGDSRAIPLSNVSFRQGTLHLQSYARPGKLFTASRSLMIRQAGALKAEAIKNIVDTIIELLRSGLNL
jgi:mRNA interferase MazF